MNKNLVLMLTMMVILILFCVYFLKEKFVTGSNFKKGCVYRSDTEGMSILYETLNKDVDLNVLVHEDRFRRFSTYGNALFVFNNFNFIHNKSCEDLALSIFNGSELLILSEENSPNWKSIELVDEKEKQKTESQNKGIDKTQNEEHIENNKDQPKLIKNEFRQNSKPSDSIILSSMKQLFANLHKSDIYRPKPNSSKYGELKAKSDYYYSKWPEEFDVAFIDKDNNAIILEVSFGKGKITLVRDPNFFYNEYMFKYKDIQLLNAVFLNAPDKKIVIDQTGLDVFVEVSIVGLLKKYGLIGVLYAAIFLGLLVFWRLLLENRFKSQSKVSIENNEKFILSVEPMINVMNQYLSAEQIFSEAKRLYKSSLKFRSELFRIRWEAANKNSNSDCSDKSSQIYKNYNKIVKNLRTGK